MQEDSSALLFFDGSSYFPMLEINLKSFIDNSPLKDIIASRSSGKITKPWVPQEENSIYVRPATNTVFITNTTKTKAELIPGFTEISLSPRSLESNIIDPYVSWHGKEGTLSIKGLKDKTLTKQTRQEYSEDKVPSVKRDDMAAQAVCFLEVIVPVNTASYQELTNYKTTGRKKFELQPANGAIKNEPHILEHPTDIILKDESFARNAISVLAFVHMGTKLAPCTLERVIDDLVCEPVTLTNPAYKGPLNCTLLFRSLGSVDQSKTLPLIFSVKSSDPKNQRFFEAIKY